MTKIQVDINCDLGESYGRFKVGNDKDVFPYISSCNIACGFHAGDPYTIEKTIELAIENKVRIGAHPSYPDLSGFGRRKMHIPSNELKSIIKYQISSLQGLCSSHGTKVEYVKPHGALYNSITHDKKEATAVIEAVQEMGTNLSLMGLANSPLKQLAQEMGINFIAEAFADRRYSLDGRLVSRTISGSTLDNPTEVSKQVLSIIKDKRVKTINGNLLEIQAQSICIHGDNPRAVEILGFLNQELENHGIELTSWIN